MNDLTETWAGTVIPQQCSSVNAYGVQCQLQERHEGEHLTFDKHGFHHTWRIEMTDEKTMGKVDEKGCQDKTEF